MSDVQTPRPQLAPEPLPDNIASAQPGGGYCYAIELAWGGVRRWYLRTFYKDYVRRMAESRQGNIAGCPVDVIDPRDLKYFVNRCTAHWNAADDHYSWRDRLWVTRWGLAELILMGAPLAVLTILLASYRLWYVAIAPAVVLVWLISFFRDPKREVPQGEGLVVSPADGTIAEVTELEFDEYVGGPAVKVGIFLSIFNVHLNRAPVAARVIRLAYRPGKFLNALNPASAWENEAMWIGMQEEMPPYRRMIVRQIAGLFARRIVCGLRPGQTIDRGAKFGMIKLGSRTELILPLEDGLTVDVSVGQKVSAGSTIMARYAS
jgi:phosphatidylserine decarboxylase